MSTVTVHTVSPLNAQAEPATPSEEALAAGSSTSSGDRTRPAPDAASRSMLEGPVLPTLLRLATPTVALMSLQGIVSAGETALVGRLGSTALAGVSLSFPMVMLMTTLSAGAYGGGVASGVARALGAGRNQDANDVAGTALTLSAVLGVAFTAFMLILGPTLYAALGATGPVQEAAVLYSNILFLGATPFWIFGAAASILRGAGNSSFPAIVGAVGGGLTLAASPVLIFGLGPIRGFGIAGAAAAIVIYNLAAMGVLLRALWTGRAAARPALRNLVPRQRPLIEILKVAIPSGLGTLLTNATVILLMGLVAPFGEAATAGYGAGGRLEYLLIPLVFGVGSALVPLVASNDGAGRFDRVQQFTRAGVALAVGGCGLIGLTVAVFPDLWMNCFTSDAAVVAIGRSYLVRVGPAYPCLGLGLALYFAAQGRGRTLQPLLATGTRLIVAGVGGFVALTAFGGTLESLFLFMTAGLTLYALIMVAVMRRELGL